MFLYNLFRVFLWLLYICFFRRVYCLNFKRIPKKEPLIFISNHSYGFMDPVLIAALQSRPVYFWIRAIEFSGGFKSWLLYKLHGLPIYRLQDGRKKMHKNRDSLRKTRELLYKKRNSVFIAPEGGCVVQKKMNPFKLGCAQLAFKMMEENNWEIDVKIQPAGVNYSYHEKFRSEVFVCIGEAISVLDYKESSRIISVGAIANDSRDFVSFPEGSPLLV